MKNREKILFILLGSLGFGIALADLTVMQDFGGTALSTYINTNMLPQKASLQNAFIAQQSAFQNNTIDANALLLPQPQTEFSPGSVSKHPISINLPMPFYLIGGDAQSLKWASENAAYLKSIHALGLVIDVSSTDQLKAIEASTGLSLMPGSVSGLSAIVGTNHYPFLVYQGWVTQ